MLYSEHSKQLLDAALDVFLARVEDTPELLYKLYYEQEPEEENEAQTESLDPSLDLAFNDAVLEDVESLWKTVIGDEAEQARFMRFEDREGMSADDDELDEGY